MRLQREQAVEDQPLDQFVFDRQVRRHLPARAAGNQRQRHLAGAPRQVPVQARADYFCFARMASVLSLSAESPCKLATSRGIKIGSTEAEVTKAYRDVRNAEQSIAGQTFVAGSIYGGAIFTIKAGKIVQIFIGAAAE